MGFNSWPKLKQLGYIGMHKRGNSTTMDKLTESYDLSVTETVGQYFKKMQNLMWTQYSIPPWRVLCDPGLGFAPTSYPFPCLG